MRRSTRCLPECAHLVRLVAVVRCGEPWLVRMKWRSVNNICKASNHRPLAGSRGEDSLPQVRVRPTCALNAIPRVRWTEL